MQDEPQNQGAWFFIQHNIHENMLDGRSWVMPAVPSASPAVGYSHLHQATAKALVDAAFAKLKGFCPDQVRPETRIQNKTLTERICHGYRRSQSPQLSESVAEATMLTWKKKPVKLFAADEILIEIETDKVVLEVPAPSAGVLAELVVGDGGTVVSDQVIAKIDTEGKAGAAAPAVAPAAAAAALLPQWQPWRHLLLAAPRAIWPCRRRQSCWPTTTCLLATWLAPARMAA